ncbi:uncharacterized protein I206_103874 [Kwoniella pini CBS 10737]|uniref:Uncharacterized protein n=1 Tax=Kwoniella pini CBS 10737 TaxID=1296096 RepID=A0AAJ8L5G7_9TREE
MGTPYNNASSSLSRYPSTHTNSSFLNHVYLDFDHPIPESPTISVDSSSPFISELTTATSDQTELSRITSHGNDEYEDLEDTQACLRKNHHTSLSAVGGGTKPLRVKKKKGVTAVKVGHSSKAKKRRSTLSFPHSPFTRESYSPIMHYRGNTNGPKRNLSTTSDQSNISRTHANISRIFLSMQTFNSPSPTNENINFDIERMKLERIFSNSSLHLGLGKFDEFDPMVKPGPSPPNSPQPSPIKRSFISTSPGLIVDDYRSKSLPNPPSPLTPSRAPRKAAALLGASTIHQQPKIRNNNRIHGLNTKHFRPLPNSTLNEIEKFFGDLPKKPSKIPSGLKAKPKMKSTGDEGGIGDRNVGQGEIVKYKAEDGSMWLDVEEEQEFAWLLSEIFALHPQPLPNLTKINSNELESFDGEDKWEMENFTSILSLPKPKTIKSDEPKSIRRIKENDNSFLNLETAKPTRGYKTTISENKFQSNPWSFNGEENMKHKRSISNPISSIPTIDKLSISPPMPTLIPPPRISSKSNIATNERLSTSMPSNKQFIQSENEFSSGFSSDSSVESILSNSPPSFGRKTKTRPPPLTLKRIKPSSKLPILTATSPQNQIIKQSTHQPRIISTNGTSQIKSDTIKENQNPKDDIPNTPFIRPRIAPKPVHNDNDSFPPVPNLPLILPKDIKDSKVNEEPISFFEPITPIQPNSSQNRINLSNGMMKEKKSWLKRVVKSVKS